MNAIIQADAGFFVKKSSLSSDDSGAVAKVDE